MEYNRFAFTLAKPSATNLQKLQQLEDITFMFYSKEKTPKSSLYHLQGYLELSKPMAPFKLKHLLGGLFYIEPARENRHVNCLYCAKDGNPYYVRVKEGGNNFSIRSYIYKDTMKMLDKFINN